MLIVRFFLQIVIGAILYITIGGISWTLSGVTVYLKAHKAPVHICLVTEYLAEFLFYVDVFCFGVFILIEAYTLVRLMWRNAGHEEKGGYDG